MWNEIYGCLVGGAIGDALGAAVEGKSAEQIRSQYGKIREFEAYDMPYSSGDAGTVTDDTTMQHYLCLSIVENEGRVTPDEYAEVLTEEMNTNRVWITEEIMLNKLLAGINPWDCGRGAIPVAVATMLIAPVGIVNACDPRQAFQDGYNIASMNQEGVNRDGAATVAAGVAEAFSPDATADRVVETMLEYSSETVFRALDLALGIAEESNSIDEFVDRFYDERLDWEWPAVEWNRAQYREGELFSGSSLEIVPAVAGILRLCGDDPNRAIVEGASFGRDCDTISKIVGNIVGSLYGANTLRQGWIEDVEAANRDLFDEVGGNIHYDFKTMAERLENAIQSECDRHRSRADELQLLLDTSEK